MIFSRNVSEALAAVFKGRGGRSRQVSVAMARGKHLFPFRTEQLSPSAPMVLGPQGPGRVGRRRSLSEPLRPCQRRPAGAERTPASPVAMADFHALPPDLPAPLDDGAADHLV